MGKILTKSEKAERLDFDIVTELLEWGLKNATKVDTEEIYFILKFEEYYVVYSRASERIQCYYVGYGHDAVDKCIWDFENLKEVIEFIEASKDMECRKTDLIRRVQREMEGLKASDYYDRWKHLMRKYENEMGNNS
jgi:hypothetical protein